MLRLVQASVCPVFDYRAKLGHSFDLAPSCLCQIKMFPPSPVLHYQAERISLLDDCRKRHADLLKKLIV
jgi:hypothetical protein